jgi:hypothetical protein
VVLAHRVSHLQPMPSLQTVPNLFANLGACSGIRIDYLGEFGGFGALHTIVVGLLLVDFLSSPC